MTAHRQKLQKKKNVYRNNNIDPLYKYPVEKDSIVAWNVIDVCVTD